MTKKILALALAGTTAFSVFAGALSVNAAEWTTWDDAVSAADAYESVTPTVLALTAGQITADDVMNVSFENPTGDGFEYDDTLFYVEDWQVNNSDATAAFKTAVEAEQAKTTGYAAVNAYPAYVTDNTATQMTLKGSTNSKWATAWSKLMSNYDDVKGYIVTGAVSPEKVAEDYDVEDFDAYDAEDLFLAIHTVATTGASGTTTLSYLTYLNSEYARITAEVGEADTSTKEERYYRALDRVQALEADDYTVYNWRTIEALLGNAEDKAAEGKWDDAYGYLEDALAINPEKATYTDLRDTLMGMYDNNGKTSASYIAEDYVGASYAVYSRSDYMTGTTPIAAWNELFSSAAEYKFEYDLDRDGTAERYNGVYGFAYEVYRRASKGVRVGQSTVDYANELLMSAIEALEPTSSSSNWSILKLETLVEIATGLNEDDFNTSAKTYKTFVTALERAETVLAKSSPAKSEVDKATTSLEGALDDVAKAAKAVPYATRKAMTDAQKQAQKLYNDYITEKVSGAQVVALKTALDKYAAGSYQTSFDIEGGAPIKALISDVEAMTAEFDAAINGFNQAQGWYTNAEGKWMYGEGDGYYVDGWKQIGNFWFFFNADGTAKQNEWFQDGSNWYYCGNSCVAYSGWGKVDGSWYYFSKANVMCTGWIRPSNSYYYLNPTSGKMVTGWAQIGGKWYYFSTDSNNLGAMLTSTTTPDGYQVGADGAMI